jgi:hypothetical protein
MTLDLSIGQCLEAGCLGNCPYLSAIQKRNAVEDGHVNIFLIDFLNEKYL